MTTKLNRSVSSLSEMVTSTKYQAQDESSHIEIKETRDSLTVDEKSLTDLQPKTSTNFLPSTIDMTKFGATPGAFMVAFNVSINIPIYNDPSKPPSKYYYYIVKGHAMFFWDGTNIPRLDRFKIEGQYSNSKHRLWNFSFYRAGNKLVPRVRNRSSETLTNVRATMKFYITTTSDRLVDLAGEEEANDTDKK